MEEKGPDVLLYPNIVARGWKKKKRKKRGKNKNKIYGSNDKDVKVSFASRRIRAATGHPKTTT
jgi:hypothetical protein